MSEEKTLEQLAKEKLQREKREREAEKKEGKGTVSLEEYQRVKGEKEELEKMVELEATKEYQKMKQKFETDREQFLSQIDDDEKRQKVSAKLEYDPKDSSTLNEAIDKLENYQFWQKTIEKAIESGGGTVTGRAPSGKATKPSERSEDAGYKKIIDDIYNQLNDPSITPQKKMALESMKNELWGAVFDGLRVAGRLPNWQMMKCPRCGNMILAPRGTTGQLSRDIKGCPNCGWTPTKYVDPRSRKG